MGSILLDSSNAPLMIFEADGAPTFAQVTDHLRDYRGILERGRPYVVLFDVRNVDMLDAKGRKAYADFLNSNAATIRRLCRGGAFVLTSSLLQGALTAILWLAPLPFPHKTFTNVDEAKVWLSSLL